MYIPEGYSELSYIFTGTPVPTGAVCTHGVINDDDTSPDDLATAAYGVWADFIMENLNSGIVLAEVSCKNGPSDTGPTGSAFGSTAGGISDDGVGPAVAFLVKKQTALGGRRSRGRMFIPGVSEATIDDEGRIEGTALTAFQEDLDSWLSFWSATPHDVVLLHSQTRILVSAPPPVYGLSPADPGDLPDPTLVTSVNLDAIVATQRRRQRR